MKQQILRYLDRANEDELRVVLYVCERLLGIGREQYGALELANDPRDFDQEMAEEAVELLVYAAARFLRGRVKR